MCRFANCGEWSKEARMRRYRQEIKNGSESRRRHAPQAPHAEAPAGRSGTWQGGEVLAQFLFDLRKRRNARPGFLSLLAISTVCGYPHLRRRGSSPYSTARVRLQHLHFWTHEVTRPRQTRSMQQGANAPEMADGPSPPFPEMEMCWMKGLGGTGISLWDGDIEDRI